VVKEKLNPENTSKKDGIAAAPQQNCVLLGAGAGAGAGAARYCSGQS
jgi:hypothetical protein